MNMHGKPTSAGKDSAERGNGLADRTVLLPGEKAETLDEIRNSLREELAPRTPYLEYLVEDIAIVLWEAVRNRRFRDALIAAEFRLLVAGVLVLDSIEKPMACDEVSKEVRAVVDTICSDDPKQAEAGNRLLTAKGFKRDEVLARAAQNVLPDTGTYDRQIASLETRRRQLYKEYLKLSTRDQDQAAT